MFLINVFGPAYKYRLELQKYASPDIKDYFIVLTDKFSYNNFYQEFHKDYKFIFLEDLRKDYPVSLERELIFSNFKSAEDHFTNITKKYTDAGNLYSYDIHRFGLLYFIENKINKVIIADSDTIFINDRNKIEEFFNTLPPSTYYGPTMGIVSHDTKIEYHIFDGWLRGFNFNTPEDTQKLFKIWNDDYLDRMGKMHTGEFGVGPGSDGQPIWSTEFIFSKSVAKFALQNNYTFDHTVAFNPGMLGISGMNGVIGRHAPRPEDNIFYVPHNEKRGCWWDYKFSWPDTRTVKAFIGRNKQELQRYYDTIFQNVNITDTHVYTKFPIK